MSSLIATDQRTERDLDKRPAAGQCREGESFDSRLGIRPNAAGKNSSKTALRFGSCAAKGVTGTADLVLREDGIFVVPLI